jgi:hypothetical protein
MKFSGITIASVVLVLSILMTLKPVSPGSDPCVILPTELKFLMAYASHCGKVVEYCPIFVDKNGDGNYGGWVIDEKEKWKFEWDPDERPV